MKNRLLYCTFLLFSVHGLHSQVLDGVNPGIAYDAGSRPAQYIENPYLPNGFRVTDDSKVCIGNDSMMNKLKVVTNLQVRDGSFLQIYDPTNNGWASFWNDGVYLHENWPFYVQDRVVFSVSLAIGTDDATGYKLKVVGPALIDNHTRFGDGPYSLPGGNSLGQYGIFIRQDGGVPRHVNYGGLGVVVNRPNQSAAYFSNIAGYSALFDQGVVGIGMTMPSEPSSMPTPSGDYKLMVNGSIKAKKMVIETSSWPDYVFAKNYRLLSLDNLEKFIHENMHLPDLPSGKEVDEKGVSIGENQALLLKKIEELTLYIIDINKKNEILMKRITMLESQKKK